MRHRVRSPQRLARRPTTAGRRLALLVALVVLAGCAAPAQRLALDRADPAGDRRQGCTPIVALDPVPQRVVVDHQRVAEIMAAIGEGGRVAGVFGDQLVVPPPSVADEVSSMEFLGGGPEAPAGRAAIERLDPDATLLTGAVDDPPTVAPVISLGAACGHEPQSVDDALDEIVQIGTLFGAEQRARRVVRRLRARVAGLRDTAVGDRQLAVTRAGSAQDPLRPVNGMIAELVELAGGHDVVPRAGDREAVVRTSDAELFLVVGHASEEDPSGLQCTVSLTVRDDLFRAFPDVPASRARQAIVLPAAASFGGIRIADDAEWLAGQIATST